MENKAILPEIEESEVNSDLKGNNIQFLIFYVGNDLIILIESRKP